MAIKKRTLNKLGLTLWMATAVVMPNVSSAAPGTLASVPLFTQANADPNILFIMDNSASMTAPLGGSNRMDVAKSTLTDLVNSLSNIRIGYATFEAPSGGIYGNGVLNPGGMVIPSSASSPVYDGVINDIATNRQQILYAIDDTSANVYATPLASALRDAGRYFSNSESTGHCGGATSNSTENSTNLILHNDATDTDSCTDILGTNIIETGPVQYQCQSNFTILLTDGLSRKDQDPIDASNPLYDYDNDCSATAQTDGGYTCTDPNPTRGSGAQIHHDRKSTYTYDSADDRTSDHLDDVAQAMFEIDLRPDLDDANGSDVTNNMRTFVIGFADPAVATNQLLQDTADQGGGTFSYAGDSTDLAASFEAATSSILNLIGSAAAVTFNSATLGTNSAVYLALFNSSSWSGDLVAYDLDDSTGAISGTSSWSAASNLNGLSDSDAKNNRTILTHNGSAGIPFLWPADYTNPTATELDANQINDLLTNVPASVDTDSERQDYGQERVDFLRGDTSNEGSLFRNRTSRLGDIVHAGPVFVGAPELQWPNGDGAAGGFPGDTDAYSIYKLNTSSDTNPGKADRPGVVYVGSNDGMLHGFATENGTLGSAGDEVLAYAPRALFSTDATRGYHYLTETGYNHQYYVDLIPTVSDVYDATDGWRTILVGGLRGGGRAIYALDVTDPENFSDANTTPAVADSIVKFEFTDADDADLGYTFSRPTIVLTNGMNGQENRWAIIFGNGYNGGAGSSGEASLFILFLDADLTDNGEWDLGSDYLKISTKTGGGADPTNGLSTPTIVDIDGDGIVDRAYAGDLAGNMWAFDLSASNEGTWGVAYGNTNNPDPLFVAGSGQPITTQPEVVMNPNVTTTSNNAPNTLVLFGTGQYLAAGDNAPQGDQTFYGIWDEGTDSLTVASLQAQAITQSGTERTVSTNTVDYTTQFGWYLPLTAISGSGERAVTNPVVRGDIVYFNTSIPTDETCSYGGTGWQMSINYATGANPETSVFDESGDGVIDDNDDALSGVEFEQGLPAAPSFLSNRRYTPGTRTQGGDEVVDDTVEELTGAGTGRLSWEEIFSDAR